MARNLTLVVHALHGGGAERVAATMANQWAAHGERVTVITLATVASDAFPVDPRVTRVGLDWMRHSRSPLHAVWNNIRRLGTLRRALRAARPTVVVSLTDQINVLTLLAARGLRPPVVIAEHSDPRRQRMAPVWERLRRGAYPRCAAAVALTGGVADHLRTLVRGRPVYVIPNAIGPPPVSAVARAAGEQPTVVALGRLSREKGFDLLIDAFARLAARYPDWRLQVAGDGPEREALTRQIERHGLAERVQLVGWVDDPARFLASGALFVLPSRYEGFPMALLEALACGLPVVAFDCDSGPRDILRPGVDGLLVPAGDVAALAETMAGLMSDPAARDRMSRRATEVVARFSLERHRQQWDEVLSACLPS